MFKKKFQNVDEVISTFMSLIYWMKKIFQHCVSKLNLVIFY